MNKMTTARRIINSAVKTKKRLRSVQKLLLEPVACLEVTTALPCTIGCVYCPQQKMLANYNGEKHLELSIFKKILTKIPRNVEIAFSGFAEPWLNPECTKMILYAIEQKYYIRVNTTLTGMNMSDISKIEKSYFTKFVVHLPSKEKLEKNFSWDEKYLNRLNALVQSDIQNMKFMCFGTIPEPVRNILSNDPHQRKIAAHEVGHSRAGNLEKKNHEQKDFRDTIACAAGFLNCNILLPNGQVQLCCMDMGLRHVLGNLKEQNYESLFQSKEYFNILHGMKNTNSSILCRRCECACPETRLLKLKESLLQHSRDLHRSCKFVARV